MHRITRRFAELRSQKRTGLVTFTMAYDPNRATSLALLKSLPASGADMVELGMPFSDPMADGPAIQAAGIRALKSGAKLKGVLKIVQEFRAHDADTPLILMGYYNPVQHYGTEAFVRDAAKSGADGLILVDLPPEEDAAMLAACRAQGIALIKLVTPTTDAARLPVILQKAEGFLYYVAVTGVTGTHSATPKDIAQALTRIRAHSTLPVAVGFGIKDAKSAKAMARHADAIVVGSALVQHFAGKGTAVQKKQAALKCVRALARAIRP